MILAMRTETHEAKLSLVTPTVKEVTRMEWDAGRALSGQILGKIQAMLESQGLGWTDLTGVVIFRGPGSFTGLRIGATVANAIAYALQVPIVGQMGADWVDEGVRRIVSGENDHQVVPEYGAEPNITKPGAA